MTTFAEPHVDITVAHPLLLVLQLPDGSLVDLTPAVSDSEVHSLDGVVRTQAPDLRAACRQAAALHAEAAAGGADVSVLVDLEVIIGCDAHTAREALEDLDRPQMPDTLRYLGTATGLAGLIADVHALQLADGVTLLPLTTVALNLILDETLPRLGTMGFDAGSWRIDSVRQALSAQRVELRSA